MGQWHPDAKDTSVGMVYQNISFNTNGTSSPLSTTFRGDGIKSITRTGVGAFLVTLVAGYYFREDVTKTADLEAANSDDGGYATIRAISGLATSSGNITMVVNTHAAGGTLTDFGTGGTGPARRCSVIIAWKTSAVGN